MAHSAPRSADAVPGIVPLVGRRAYIQKIAVLLITVLPFVGLIGAITSLWGWGISGIDLGIMLVLYVATGLGVTVGYHRMLTHKAFTAPKPVTVAFAVAGSMAIEGSVISWVADHRRHHAYADKHGDPHSPHVADQEGLVGTLKGLWHAHMGWLFELEESSPQRWAPDLYKDRALRVVDRFFPLWVTLSLGIPALVGFALSGTFGGALTAFLWGGLARVFLLHHVTWSVNSICHYFGTRPFETPDLSTNNWPLAIISFGESWHNNHHAFPTAAVHGIKKWQIDPSGIVIWLLEKVRLARDVKRVSPKQIVARSA